MKLTNIQVTSLPVTRADIKVAQINRNAPRLNRRRTQKARRRLKYWANQNAYWYGIRMLTGMGDKSMNLRSDAKMSQAHRNVMRLIRINRIGMVRSVTGLTSRKRRRIKYWVNVEARWYRKTERH